MDGTAGVLVRLVDRAENDFGCWERAEVSVVLWMMRGRMTTPEVIRVLAYQRHQRYGPHSLYVAHIRRSQRR